MSFTIVRNNIDGRFRMVDYHSEYGHHDSVAYAVADTYNGCLVKGCRFLGISFNEVVA